MPKLEKPDFKAKRGIPNIMKLILLIAVIVGIWGRSCWRDNEKANITFENIALVDTTSVSVVVAFDLVNNTRQSGRKGVSVDIYTAHNEKIASRVISVDIEPKSTNRIVRLIDNFERPLKPEERLGKALIELYHKSAFN